MAASYCGQYIQQTRERRGLSFGAVARTCGAVTPREISKLAQRLVRLERDESIRERKLLLKLIDVLDLDIAVVNELLGRQRAKEMATWNRWADERVPFELLMRPFAGVWIRQPLPDEIRDDEARAIEYARSLTSGRTEMQVVLVLDRRRSLTFAAGRLVSRHQATGPQYSVRPFCLVAGKPFVFDAAR